MIIINKTFNVVEKNIKTIFELSDKENKLRLLCIVLHG